MECIAIRRADGRKTSLEESTPSKASSAWETARAEEIIIELPNGRRRMALKNAMRHRGLASTSRPRAPTAVGYSGHLVQASCARSQV